MRTIGRHITVDQEVQNGQPVFSGTRVPVQTLFWHLEKGITIEEFLEDFPSVTKEQAIGVLEMPTKLSTLLNWVKSMKLLIDENLPKRLKLDFPEHEIFTVNDMGWNSMKNGELLKLIRTRI